MTHSLFFCREAGIHAAAIAAEANCSDPDCPWWSDQSIRGMC